MHRAGYPTVQTHATSSHKFIDRLSNDNMSLAGRSSKRDMNKAEKVAVDKRDVTRLMDNVKNQSQLIFCPGSAKFNSKSHLAASQRAQQKNMREQLKLARDQKHERKHERLATEVNQVEHDRRSSYSRVSIRSQNTAMMRELEALKRANDFVDSKLRSKQGVAESDRMSQVTQQSTRRSRPSTAHPSRHHSQATLSQYGHRPASSNRKSNNREDALKEYFVHQAEAGHLQRPASSNF